MTRYRNVDEYQGPATIIQGDREAEAVCRFQVRRELLDVGHGEWIEGLYDWTGGLTVTSSAFLDPGEAEIRLPDRRVGTILVTDLNEFIDGSGVLIRALFVGNGEPPT